MNTATKMSRQMKLSAMRCITRINLKRRMNHLQTIPNYSTNVLKLLRIYKFYKATQFRMNLRKQIQQRKAHGRNRRDEPPEEKESKKIVIKDGYKFILLDGLYYKLTKKSYTKEEIERWCTGRKNASSKMKIYHKEKKIERGKKEKDQIAKTNAIYDREISTYPKGLRELFV